MTRGRIVVLGATGATGRKVVHLAAAADLVPIAVGRREAPLQELVRAAPGEVEIRVATLDQLDGALTDAAVVICGIGPATTYGATVVAATIEAGAHYVDFSGEPRWAADLATRFAPAARRQGCVLVPAAGLGAAGELAALAAADGLPRVDEVTIAYRVRGMRPSVATMRSSCEIVAGGAPRSLEGVIEFAPAGGVSPSLPDGRGVGFPTPDPVVLATRWPEATIRTWMQVPAPHLVGPLMAGAARLLIQRPVLGRVRDALSAWADRPSAHDQAGGGRAAATALVATHGENPRVARAEVDDVYDITARSGFAAARGLLHRPPAPGLATWASVLDTNEATPAEQLRARVVGPGPFDGA